MPPEFPLVCQPLVRPISIYLPPIRRIIEPGSSRAFI
jgi:hypothetical protein